MSLTLQEYADHIDAVVSASSFSNDLILNPGFETAGGGGADVFANWTEQTGPGGSVADELVIIHSGAHAAKCTANLGLGLATVKQDIVVVPGTQYNFTFWVYSTVYASDLSGYLAPYNVLDNTHVTTILNGNQNIVSQGSTWTAVSVGFTAPAGCVSVGIYLSMYSAGKYSGSIYFDDVVVGAVRLLRRCFVNDIDYADTLTTLLAAGTFEDRTVVQGHTYYYWVTEIDQVTVIDGPTPGLLKEYKLFGRKGTGSKKTIDYDVECGLCGFKVRRNLLRRGYVDPHKTGENYLPYAAAPESWTWTEYASPVVYYDANVLATSIPQGVPYVFPQIGKDSDYRTPPGQNSYPGTPYVSVDNTNYVKIAFAEPTDTFSGYLITWFYQFSGSFQLRVFQGLTEVVKRTVTFSNVGWRRYVDAMNFDTGDVVYVKIRPTAGLSAAVVFGGAMAVKVNDPAVALPHRSSALGNYTTGGMMDLCPSCYSGLRKRVPWE